MILEDEATNHGTMTAAAKESGFENEAAGSKGLRNEKDVDINNHHEIPRDDWDKGPHLLSQTSPQISKPYVKATLPKVSLVLAWILV